MNLPFFLLYTIKFCLLFNNSSLSYYCQREVQQWIAAGHQVPTQVIVCCSLVYYLQSLIRQRLKGEENQWPIRFSFRFNMPITDQSTASNWLAIVIVISCYLQLKIHKHRSETNTGQWSRHTKITVATQLLYCLILGLHVAL